MRLLSLLILCSLVFLGACAPATETVSYTLPPTAGGRLCSHQCVEAQDYCHQACDMRQRQCVMQVQTRAMQDYDAYTRSQFFNHQPIELKPSDFERQTPCIDSRSDCTRACDHHYQTCFQDCGGQVGMKTSCQFLCF